MKPIKVEDENSGSLARQAAPPSLPLQFPGSWARRTGSTPCITNREIAEFWRRKRIEEEDHLLAAIKAAARVRARNFSVRSSTAGSVFLHLISSLLLQLNSTSDPEARASFPFRVHVDGTVVSSLEI